MKIFKNILKAILISSLVATLCSSISTVFAATKSTTDQIKNQINQILQQAGQKSQTELSKEHQGLPQQAIDSYNEICVIDAKTNQLTNDLALLNEFINDKTYRIKIRADFQGGELKEIIDATDGIARDSILKNLNNVKIKFYINEKTPIEKDAIKELIPGRGEYIDANYFTFDLNENEWEFNKEYLAELINKDNDETIGYLKIKIPESLK